MTEIFEIGAMTIELHESPTRRTREAPLHHLASDIMCTLQITDEEEILESVDRAIHACQMLHIPVSDHFRREFLYDELGIIEDWRLSSLACYLIIINSDPRHECVARAQLYFAMNNIGMRA